MDKEHSVPGCPDGEEEATVLEYLSGDADAGERQRFEAHLAGCEACASELQQWVLVREAISASPAPAAELDSSTMDEREARWGGWRELLAGIFPGRAPAPLHKLGWALSATLVVVVTTGLGVDRVAEWLVESDSPARGFVPEAAPTTGAESTWSWPSTPAARDVRGAMEGDADARAPWGEGTVGATACHGTWCWRTCGSAWRAPTAATRRGRVLLRWRTT